MPDKVTVIKPPALKPGDCIGVIATSAPVEPARFAKGIAALEARGFRVQTALSPSAAYGSNKHLFSSDTALRRTAALHELMTDPQVKVICAARGAYGSMELLPYIDCDKLRAAPKIFCGFSDATVLLTALHQGSSVVTVHGPSIESLWSRIEQGADLLKSADAQLELFCRGTVSAFSAVTPRRIAGQGSAVGALFGGNLTMLCALMGTPWEPCFEDRIVFLEDTGESPYRIHRSLLQLKLGRKFERARGVLLGDFSNCKHPRGVGPTIDETLAEFFSEFSLPVFHAACFGHQPLNLSLPLGITADISDQRLELKESAVLL